MGRYLVLAALHLTKNSAIADKPHDTFRVGLLRPPDFLNRLTVRKKTG